MRSKSTRIIAVILAGLMALGTLTGVVSALLH